MVAFYGVRQYGSTVSAGIRVCGLVACETDDTKTCGKRIKSADQTTFLKISIIGTFPNLPDTFDQPTTLKTNLNALDLQYQFYKNIIGDKIVVNMSSNNEQSSLLSFGIYGRVYNNDGKTPGKYNSSYQITANIFLLVISFVLTSCYAKS